VLLCVALGAVLAVPLAAMDLADPTRPPDSLRAVAPPASEEPGALRLRSILVSPERRVAVISGRRVQVGDRIGGADVVSISSTTVQLRGPGGRVTLSLWAGRVRRPSELEK
jgi:MSHA biogenesis protein MshK